VASVIFLLIETTANLLLIDEIEEVIREIQ
jgi:hypothetical protein